MELSDYREAVEQIDRSILELFVKRMQLCRAIGRCKREKGLPVRDEALEQQKLQRLSAAAPSELQAPCRRLLALLFSLSRELQGKDAGE